MRKLFADLCSAFIYILTDKSGGVKGDSGENPDTETLTVTTEEIEIDGVVYRITAEFKGGVEFDKTLAEWALRKVIDEMKTVA